MQHNVHLHKNRRTLSAAVQAKVRVVHPQAPALGR